MYHGMCKPSDPNEFLKDFVDEFLLLNQNGITVSNKKYAVSLNANLCDAPSKSFITCTKGHTGYFAYPKCFQKGKFVQNRVVYLEINNTLRHMTHLKIVYILSITQGILENLSIGMVSQIPLDYMHLVCLGVTKRLLQIWLRGNKHVRLSMDNIQKISGHLILIKPCIPFEFARKPRSLNDIDQWKATELRQFLLYTGIVIMKLIL